MYWRQSSHVNLKSIAASVFCIPVSSAEPERHNSAAGNSVTAMRNRLNPTTVETLFLLNEFFKNE